jgi:hypothetical protein
MLWFCSALAEVLIGWWRCISGMSSNVGYSAPSAMAGKIWVGG